MASSDVPPDTESMVRIWAWWFIFAIGIQSSMAWAQTPRPPGDVAGTPCSRCPDTALGCTECTSWTEVGIDIVAADVREDWDFASESNIAQTYLSHAPPHIPPLYGRFYIRNAAEIRRILIDAAYRCKRVSYLHYSGHGNRGALVPNGDWFTVERTNEVLHGLSCVMAPESRVHLDGCLIGQGCRGQHFMRAVAHHLLRSNGGAIVANDDYASGFRFGLTRNMFDVWDGPQRLDVDGALAHETWRHEPASADVCHSEVTDAITRMRSLVRLMERCSSAPFAVSVRSEATDLIASLRGLLPDLDDYYATASDPYTQVHRVFTVEYYTRISRAQGLARAYGHTSCSLGEPFMDSCPGGMHSRW